MKKQKIVLEDLKLKSFVTEINSPKSNLRGGSNACDTTQQTDNTPCPTAETFMTC